jgi:hypothetical protein
VKTFLILTGLCLIGGGAALFGAGLLARYWPRPRARAPRDTEPPSAALRHPAARWALRLRLLVLRTPAGKAPGVRRPVRHQGADRRYGAELNAMRREATCAELRTPAEQMVIDHAGMAAIGTAVAAFDLEVDRLLDVFLRDLPQVRIRVASAAEQTGEFDATALRELLGADDGLVTA